MTCFIISLIALCCGILCAESSENLVPNQEISGLENISNKIDKTKISKTGTMIEKIEKPDIFVFNCWSPKIDSDSSKSFLVKKIKELFQDNDKNNDNNIKITDFSNKYKVAEDSLAPKFDTESVSKQILEAIDAEKKLILIAYSEGAFGLLESIINLIKLSRERKITEKLAKFLKVCFIDPPTEEFFLRTKDLHSTFFWFVGWVADWVQWIAGVSPQSKLSDRYFPLLSDIFLWSFRQFWKFFLVPISNSNISKFEIKFGHDNMFNRTLFAKSRAFHFGSILRNLSSEDAQLMKEFTTLYLQNWRDKAPFKKLGDMPTLASNLNHSSIIEPALSDFLKNI